MRLLASRFAAEFTEAAASHGWSLDFVDDDEFIVYTRPQAVDIQARLGLDLIERDFGLSLNPTVSVRHMEISRLHAEFFGFQRGASQAAATLSDLARTAGRGSGVMWTVEGEAEVRRMVVQVLTDVSQLGEPFFARYASVSDLVRRLEQSAKINLDLAQLAIAYTVIGDFGKADSVISALVEMADQQPPLLAQQTRQFITGFRATFK